MLPQLKSLNLGMFELTSLNGIRNFDYETSFLGRLLSQSPQPLIAGSQQRLFGNLNHVHLDLSHDLVKADQSLNLFDLHIAPPFLRLPSLSSFKASGGRLKSTLRHWDCAPGLSSVSSISLHHCDIGTRALTSMIDSCSALKSLTCLRSRIAQTEPAADMNWPVIVHALEKHQQTLEFLALKSYTLTNNVTALDAPQDIAVSSLHALQKLRYLDLDDEAMFGLARSDRGSVPDQRYQVRTLLHLLPPNLEHFVIREARRWHQDKHAVWAYDCEQLGYALDRHSTMRRIDAIGFENPAWQKAFLVRKLPNLVVECNDWTDERRWASQSTRLIKQGIDSSAVIEPLWLTSGPRLWEGEWEGDEQLWEDWNSS